MLGGTATRIYLAAAVILLTFSGSRLVENMLEPPAVALPSWSFNELPRQLGDWHGEDTQLDPKITATLGAEVVVDRLYRDDLGRVISLHTSMFTDRIIDGIYHTPIACYYANGWELVENVPETLKVSDQLTIPVRLLTYKREGERIVVVYWYQLGEHFLFNRWDLGIKVRWSLFGRPRWPPLIKVMLQLQAPELVEAKVAILKFAELIAKWQYQPQHLLEDESFSKKR